MARNGDPPCESVSIVVIALNEGVELEQTIASITATVPDDVEILVIDDGSTDGCADFLESDNRVWLFRSRDLGVAGARNFGARQSTGDVIFFADAHTRYPQNWLPPLLDVLGEPEVGAASPAVYDLDRPDEIGYGLRFKAPDLSVGWLQVNGGGPQPAPILPGCSVAMRRDVFIKTGGFDAGLIRTGSVDNELGVRLWTLGYQLLVTPAVAIGHRFRPRHPYPVQWSTFLHNRLRMALIHFNQARIARVVREWSSHEAFPAAVALAAETDVLARRAEHSALRTADDEWFFSRFAMPY